jgi:hypothetical protein
MTRAEFDGQMRRLAGLRFMPADLATHYEGLRDLPVTALMSAVSRAIRTRSEFPTPHELRMDADVEARAVPVEAEPADTLLAHPVDVVIPASALTPALTLHITHAHDYACDVCRDTGWASLWCGQRPSYAWLAVHSCGRQGGHGEHEWVRHCHCRSTNRVLARRRAAAAVKYAQEPARAPRY